MQAYHWENISRYFNKNAVKKSDLSVEMAGLWELCPSATCEMAHCTEYSLYYQQYFLIFFLNSHSDFEIYSKE